MQQSTSEVDRQLLTVRQFSERFPAWTEPGVRNLILNAETRLNSRGDKVPGNGLAEAGAIVRVGRKVLVDVGAFMAWIAEQQKQRRKAA